ncbi:hypothetical protein ACHQM5_014251 [Ranunculus cassubicifolius]
MLLRSSSTPILGSLLSSMSDTPNRDFDVPRHSSASSDYHPRVSFSHGGHTNFSSFSCNSSPITPPVDHESSTKKSSSGLRRAQSDGNLDGLISCDIDDFDGSKPLPKSTKKTHRPVLETIPSFSIHNRTNGYDESEEEEEEDDEDELGEWGGELTGKDGFMIRSITIGDNINGLASGDFTGDLSFEKSMDLMHEEGGRVLSGFQNFSGIDEEGYPKSPPLYLAAGLGIGGFGGLENVRNTDFCVPDGGKGDCNNLEMEQYYKQMVDENPGNALFLRNYAQFLYQSKGDLRGAEEYFSRAILSDPGDGEMLSQYAKIVWELHHDYERALSYFERSVHASAEDSHVHAAYANFLWETEEDAEEVDCFPKDIAGFPIFQNRVMTSMRA